KLRPSTPAEISYMVRHVPDAAQRERVHPRFHNVRALEREWCAADPGPPQAPSRAAAVACTIPGLQRIMSSATRSQRSAASSEFALLMLHCARDPPIY